MTCHPKEARAFSLRRFPSTKKRGFSGSPHHAGSPTRRKNHFSDSPTREKTLETKPLATPGVHAATAASAAMIAQQVAGKAARDTLFLSNFSVRMLPTMMAMAAVLSLVGVLWLSRVITKHSPARVVPFIFLASAVALVGEFFLSLVAPGVAAVLVYFHTSVFGPAVISSFWSLMNERFDPHTARRAVARVAGGGTLGGVLGSLAAWRAASFIAVPTMLLFLAAANLVCVWGTFILRVPKTAAAVKKETEAELGIAVEPSQVPSAFRVLRDAPYLRSLSLLVALGERVWQRPAVGLLGRHVSGQQRVSGQAQK